MSPHDGIFTWINQKRVRDYPRLMLIATWLILAVNVMLKDGWVGGLGQIIGGDFVVLYSTGLLYLEDPDSIYNFDRQFQIQQELISPTPLPGLNPYISPPYVAAAYSLLSVLPLPRAFIAWTVLMIILAAGSVGIFMHILPDEIKAKGLGYGQCLILVLSFFPFIESLQAGQNSGLTLFLMTCLVYFSMKEKQLLSGIFAGLMIYKPQYILGFLILWVVWKNFRALAGFALIVFVWAGTVFLLSGPQLFFSYLDLSKPLLLLPYMEGFPAYILVTLYGLLTTLFPQSTQAYLSGISQAVLVACILFLAFYAFKLRHKPTIERIPIITFAMLLPLFATPYTLLHDLVILIPGFVLWTRYNPRRELLLAAIIIYFGTFFLTLISALSHIALNALLVTGLVVLIIQWLVRERHDRANPVVAM